MTNKFKRIEWVDVAKAIAILMMVIGHEVQGNARVFIFFLFICHCSISYLDIQPNR